MFPAFQFPVTVNAMQAAVDKPSQLPDQDAAISQEAIAWFSRLRITPLSPEDRDAFQRWCGQSPSHERAFRRVSGMWDNPMLKAAAAEAVARTALTPPSRDRHRPRRLAYSAAAAAIALLIVVTLQWDLVTRSQADVYTSVGEQRTIELPDRSTVVLNTQTALAVAYEQSVRRVSLLKGEALFSVQPDRERPFVVEHRGISTQAVGTQFLVHSTSHRDTVTVVEGIVTVSAQGRPSSEATLHAGTQVLVEDGEVGAPHTVDTKIATAWLRGRLVVTSVPLAVVVDELRRYYPGTIVVLNPEVGRIKVTGTYHLSDPQELLTTLSTTLSFHMVSLTDRVAVLY